MLFSEVEEALNATSRLLVKAAGEWLCGVTNADAVIVPAMNELKIDAAILMILMLCRKC